VVKRSYVKVDRFGIETLARAHDLTAIEAWILLTLVLRADFRTWKWQGTLSELASDALTSRNTATSAVLRLWERGMIVTVTPFGRGAHGVLFVPSYPDLVVPELRASDPPQIAQNCANPRPTDRAGFALTTRRERATNAQNCAIAGLPSSNDASPRSSDAAKESGSDAEQRAVALTEQLLAGAVVGDERSIESAALCTGCGYTSACCACDAALPPAHQRRREAAS
jgi:hypothetical protein